MKLPTILSRPAPLPQVPASLEALEALPGVGHKTASVVMCQAFGWVPPPAVLHACTPACRWNALIACIYLPHPCGHAIELLGPPNPEPSRHVILPYVKFLHTRNLKNGRNSRMDVYIT